MRLPRHHKLIVLWLFMLDFYAGAVKASYRGDFKVFFILTCGVLALSLILRFFPFHHDFANSNGEDDSENKEKEVK